MWEPTTAMTFDQRERFRHITKLCETVHFIQQAGYIIYKVQFLFLVTFCFLKPIVASNDGHACAVDSDTHRGT